MRRKSILPVASTKLSRIAKAIGITPVPVEVRQPDPSALESLQSLISPLLHPLATTGLWLIGIPRTCACNASDSLPCRARASCRTFGIP
jgi:hypothetical protein